MLAQLSSQVEAMREERAAVKSAPAGDSEAALQLGQLENRLDKMVVKCSEASHIRKTYEMILQKLEEVKNLSGSHIALTNLCVATGVLGV